MTFYVEAIQKGQNLCVEDAAKSLLQQGAVVPACGPPTQDAIGMIKFNEKR